MIGGPPRHLRHHASKAQGRKVERVNENFNDADWIVFRYIVVQTIGKQCRLPAVLASTKRFMPTPADRNHTTRSTRPHSRTRAAINAARGTIPKAGILAN